MEISVEQAPRTDESAISRLTEEHRDYSRQLDAILAHPHLSDDEQAEATRLKKLKLKLKDEMEGRLHPSLSGQLTT